MSALSDFQLYIVATSLSPSTRHIADEVVFTGSYVASGELSAIRWFRQANSDAIIKGREVFGSNPHKRLFTLHYYFVPKGTVYWKQHQFLLVSAEAVRTFLDGHNA